MPDLLAVIVFIVCAGVPRVSSAATCAVMASNIGTGTATASNASTGAPIGGALINWTYAGHAMHTATDSTGTM